METKGQYIIRDTMRYAQGHISTQFTDVLRKRIEQVESEAEFEKYLSDAHDALLICRNEQSGLQAAVRFLMETAIPRY